MTPGGLWDSDKYEIVALVKTGGKITDRVPLKFSGATSVFVGDVTVKKAGNYEIIVYAYDPQTGNTGVSRLPVKVS